MNFPIGQRKPKAIYVLGLDLARLGQDSSVYLVLEKAFGSDEICVAFIKEFKHNLLNEAIDYVKFLDKYFFFEKIYMDTTGLGAGPYDFLVVDPKYMYRTVDCKFSSSLDGKPFKEVMYTNLKMLMERSARGEKGGLYFPEHRGLIYQMIDLRYEIAESGRVKIHHSDRGHDDFPDALGLAALHFRANSPISQQGCWAIG